MRIDSWRNGRFLETVLLLAAAPFLLFPTTFLAGTLLTLLIIITILIAVALCWQAARHDAALRPYALGFLAGLIAFHVYGLTDTIALGAKPGILFWWLLGLITTLPQITQKFV